jgi:hypothetical protein
MFHAARGATILARHANALRAFLHKAGLIDYHHRPWITDMLDHIRPQVITDFVRRPGGATH